MEVMTTEQLIKANQIAVERGYNRQLTDEFIESLDPDGFHIISFTLLHEHAAGVRVDPHLRTIVYTKVADQAEPVQVQMDIDMDLFNTFGKIIKDENGQSQIIPGKATPVPVIDGDTRHSA